MLRDLVSLFGRSSQAKSRRRRRGNNLRSLLSVESLEERVVLATTVAITPESGVFGLQNFEYDYQRLASFTITTDDFNLPTFTIDWGGVDGGVEGFDRSLQWLFTRQELSLEPGGTSTFTGIMFGRFNYAETGLKTAVITTTIPAIDPESEDVVLSTDISIRVAGPVVGPDNVLNILPPITAPLPDTGPAYEGQSLTFGIEADFGELSVDEFWIDWGDGIQQGIGGGGLITHTYADDSPFALDQYRVSIMAIIDDQFYATTSPGVYVKDIAPTVVISGDSSVQANETYTLNLSSSDVPEDQPILWAVCWDYTGNVETDFFEFFVGNPSSVTHVYDSDGPRTIRAILADDDGVQTFSNELPITVGSQPTADAGGPYTTLADVPITLTGVGAGGTNLSYAWDLDGDDEYGEAGEVGAVVTFDPGGVAGTRTVRLRVTDEDTHVVSAADEATITVLATGAIVVDNTLHVLGSGTGGDTVSVTVSGGNLVVNTGSGPQIFSLSSVNELNIRTGGGNDIINIAAAVTVPTTVDAGDGDDLIIGGSGRSVLMGGAGSDIIYGGAGNDVLLGGTGNDLILGGNGDDVLVGGGGIDILEGGNGRDLLIGGIGSDALLGGNGDDILVGGYTIHDGNVAALDDIMAIWSSAASLNARIALLTSVGGLLEANQAVFDDDALDVITGGAGADLIFGDRSLLGDGVIDLIALQAAQDRLIALN